MFVLYLAHFRSLSEFLDLLAVCLQSDLQKLYNCIFQLYVIFYVRLAPSEPTKGGIKRITKIGQDYQQI